MPTEKWSAGPTVFGVVRKPDPVSFLRLSSRQAVTNAKDVVSLHDKGCKVDSDARIARQECPSQHGLPGFPIRLAIDVRDPASRALPQLGKEVGRYATSSVGTLHIRHI
jgi:hypothetical protein